MHISIVTTLYNSSLYIKEFYDRAITSASEITDDFEIIFVNDGSPDSSLTEAIRLYQLDPRVKVVELSRNYGHHKAIMAGLEHCNSDYVFLIDSDLEESPEWLSDFYEILKTEKVDAAVGIQETRMGQINKRVGGKLFYKVLNRLSSIYIPENVTIARLMSRRYVESLLLHHESELFFAGLCVLTGYQQSYILVDKPYKGSSSYSLRKRINQAINAIASFSNKPLYIIFVLGCLIFICSGLAIFVIIIQKIFYSLQVGYASLVASIWGVGGMTMMCVGVLGIYLAKIFSEVKRRPTIVKRVLQKKRSDDD